MILSMCSFADFDNAIRSGISYVISVCNSAEFDNAIGSDNFVWHQIHRNILMVMSSGVGK